MNTRTHFASALLAAVLVVLAIGSVDESDTEGDDFTEPPMFDSDERPITPPASRPREDARPPTRSDSADRSVLPDGIRSDLDAAIDSLNDRTLTDDQRERLFSRDYEGDKFLVSGRVKDAGTWLGHDYVTVQLKSGVECDVYPRQPFDILAVRKGQQIEFVGRFSFPGKDPILKRQFNDAYMPGSENASAERVDTALIDLRNAIGKLSVPGLSLEQAQIVFERDYKDRMVEVTGIVVDSGTWIGDKYVTIRIDSENDCDVYPGPKFDLLKYRNGQRATFYGRFTFYAPEGAFHHRVEYATDQRP